MRVLDNPAAAQAKAAHAMRNPEGSGARFTLDGLAPDTARARAQAPVAILGGLDALIAIRAEENTRERRRRSARRGQGMLDVLDDLKLAVLEGRIAPGLQNRLLAALAGAGASGDTHLDGIITEIELRAEVELAKLRMREKQAAEDPAKR